jgi:hypothetical protein
MGILSSCVVRQPFYLIRTIFPSSSFLSFLAGFNRKIMSLCRDMMGLGSWEFIQGLLPKTSSAITDFLWWYKFLSMEDYAPSTFLGSWALVPPYLCFKFHIFNRPILKKYVSQVKGGHTSFSHALMHFEIA